MVQKSSTCTAHLQIRHFFYAPMYSSTGQRRSLETFFLSEFLREKKQLQRERERERSNDSSPFKSRPPLQSCVWRRWPVGLGRCFCCGYFGSGPMLIQCQAHREREQIAFLLLPRFSAYAQWTHTHNMYTHTYIYVYICIHTCVCVFVCLYTYRVNHQPCTLALSSGKYGNLSFGRGGKPLSSVRSQTHNMGRILVIPPQFEFRPMVPSLGRLTPFPFQLSLSLSSSQWPCERRGLSN